MMLNVIGERPMPRIAHSRGRQTFLMDLDMLFMILIRKYHRHHRCTLKRPHVLLTRIVYPW